ncbi:ISBma2-like transposase [Bacillus sp. 1NLA3E]|nr:ISBma2-like transposase [Bacillus sp. 1NLA3E]
MFQELFDEIVHLPINHKMVGGRVLFTDSTHLKANANKHKFRTRSRNGTWEYFDDLSKAKEEDRIKHGKCI